MKETTDKTGVGQATDIIKSLEDHDMDPQNLAFQSYDFVSDMSGHTNGAQAIVSRELNRNIPAEILLKYQQKAQKAKEVL